MQFERVGTQNNLDRTQIECHKQFAILRHTRMSRLTKYFALLFEVLKCLSFYKFFSVHVLNASTG